MKVASMRVLLPKNCGILYSYRFQLRKDVHQKHVNQLISDKSTNLTNSRPYSKSRISLLRLYERNIFARTQGL